MSAGTKAFWMRGPEDWKGGTWAGVTADRDGLLCPEGNGWYLSAPLDSRETGTVWHRLRLDADLPEDGRLDLYVMAADGREDVETALRDPALPAETKRALFRQHGAAYTNALDVPLFSIAGRWLWFWLEVTGRGSGALRIRSVKVEFPRVAFVDYLPQLYRRGAKDAFLARFLMLFQSVYVDCEERLEGTPGCFAPERAPRAYVAWMAEWFGLDRAADWPEETLRALLPKADWLCRSKGTCASIRFLVQSYTGEVPLLIEQFDALALERAVEKRETLLRLYGAGRRAFTVLVSHTAAPDAETRRALLRLLRYTSPMDAVCRLAVLPEGLTLDAHCYLERNTRLPRRALRGLGEMELML